MKKYPSERWILFVLGLAQFVNILEFMMVMPLGPDFAKSLGLDLSKIGMVAASYTVAASIIGLCGVFLFARVNRRLGLCWSLLGLGLGTLAGGLAEDETTLILARVLAGFFGGPATAFTNALIADYIPIQRRGRAMGALMGAFSLAAILGVPLSLEIAERGGWRLSFLCVGLLALTIAIFVRWFLPEPKQQDEESPVSATQRRSHLFRRPQVWLSYAMTSLGMMYGFLIIPNMAAYLQGNLQFPRADMGELYFTGGILSFLAMRVGGFLVDRYGSAIVTTVVTLGLMILLYWGFYQHLSFFTPLVLFMTFMPLMSVRNVSANAINTKVPKPHERASYMSALSSINHIGSGGGALLSTYLLVDGPGGILIGVPRVALLSLTLAFFTLPLMFLVERGLRSDYLAIKSKA